MLARPLLRFRTKTLSTSNTAPTPFVDPGSRSVRHWRPTFWIAREILAPWYSWKPREGSTTEIRNGIDFGSFRSRAENVAQQMS